MNEQTMHRALMIAGAALAIISASGAVLLLILTFTNGLWLIIPTVLLAIATVACGWVASYFGERYSGHTKVFTNEIEREVLNRKQRKELRTARGDLVMQRSLVEIENERDNIVHRQIEASHDPNKPPHKTRFGD
jgi:hypothetical protein